MNQAQLLAHFDHISDAPDAITRLRRFILELAVRGKLVEQDPRDEPAPELLKRIQAEKVRLVKAGKIKESQPLTSIDGAKTPYEIPSSWEWVPLGETVNSHLGGGTPSKNNSSYWDGDIFWASVKDVGKGKYIDETIDRITEAGLADSSSNLIPPGNLIIVTRMGLGKLSINRVPIAINQDLRALSVSSLSAIDYHYIFFKTHGFEGTGLTVKGIRVEELLNIAFPLPPLAEQHRIVAKVDELMALADRLEAAQMERESRRDRLVASSLHQLNSGADPAAFRDHARFYFNHLPHLTTRTEHIQQLRQTILNLAVRGKLVSQDPNDRRSYPETTANEPEDAFELPLYWHWVAVKDLLQEKMVNGISIKGQDEPPGIRALKLNSIKTDGIDTSIFRYLPLTEERALPLKLKPGDFLLARGNGSPDLVARGALVKTSPREITIFPDTMIRVRLKQSISSEWFSRIWNSKFVRLQIRSLAKTAVGLWKVSQDQIGSVVLPLPPLAEQQRIVAKVDELMALCDRLEAQLTTTQNESRRLLEALLHEALAPAV